MQQAALQARSVHHLWSGTDDADVFGALLVRGGAPSGPEGADVGPPST
jgi:hypothetical protein